MRYNPFFDTRPRQEEPDDDAPIVWETDADGRQFRKVGNCIEYRPTIETSYGTLYQDEAAEQIKRIKEHEEAMRKAAIQAKKPTRYCPFKRGRNQLKLSCEKECTFYDDGCVLANAETAPTIDTDGRYCPIAGQCTDGCAMYNHGCNLVEIFKCMKHGKE